MLWEIYTVQFEKGNSSKIDNWDVIPAKYMPPHVSSWLVEH